MAFSDPLHLLLRPFSYFSDLENNIHILINNFWVSYYLPKYQKEEVMEENIASHGFSRQNFIISLYILGILDFVQLLIYSFILSGMEFI